MTKNKEYDVIREDTLSNIRGVWVESTEGGEMVKVLPHEFEVIYDDRVQAISHVWEKQNIITLKIRGQYIDKLKCRTCGITAKRIGLSRIVIDARYKHQDYQDCGKAAERIRRHNKRLNK